MIALFFLDFGRWQKRILSLCTKKDQIDSTNGDTRG